MSEMVVSITGLVMRRRSRATIMNMTNPASVPPPAASRKWKLICPSVTAPARAAIAVRRATSALASLRSDSPSKTVTTRRGSPMRRPIAVAATASGGATTAPIASAAAQPRPGISQFTTAPTAKVVTTTRPTDNKIMGRRLAAKSTSEVCSAAV